MGGEGGTGFREALAHPGGKVGAEKAGERCGVDRDPRGHPWVQTEPQRPAGEADESGSSTPGAFSLSEMFPTSLCKSNFQNFYIESY